MSIVRCYIPLSAPQLRELGERDALAGPLPAWTVTPAIEQADPEGDEESWEYAALQQAVADRLAASAPVVLAAADLPAELVVAAGEGAPTSVTELALARIAAFHLGDDVVTGDRSALPAEDEEVELSWYDTTELDQVLALTLAAGAGDPA